MGRRNNSLEGKRGRINNTARKTGQKEQLIVRKSRQNKILCTRKLGHKKQLPIGGHR
jgi:hypothetical protein